MSETTGLTRHEAKRAVTALVNRGLVPTWRPSEPAPARSRDGEGSFERSGIAHRFDFGNDESWSGLRDWEETNLLWAIEHASVPHVEGVGTLRMTHRADTGNTKAWRQQINGESRDTIFFYRQVAEALGTQVPELAGLSTSEAAAA